MTDEAPFLVQGMGLELVEPDWPPLTTAEVRRVLDRLSNAAGSAADVTPTALVADGATIEWHSPRPFSTVAVVRVPEQGSGADSALQHRWVIVKRHHRRVRTANGLQEEHKFLRYLKARGVPVPIVAGSPLADGDFVYEVQERLAGCDLYREALSWTPFRSEAHAGEAGAALARLHLASERYGAPARRPAPLLASSGVSCSVDPVAAIASVAAARPGLADFLSTRHWRKEVGDALIALHRRFFPYAAALIPLWAHNDWHPSNLFWSCAGSSAQVVGVIDFGLCNQTSACYDLATAIERSAIGWLDPATRREVHLDQMRALIRGYRSVRPLSAGEKAALPRLLPMVHVEYALSEIEYFHALVGSKENAELAYEAYLLDHLRWFVSKDGSRFCSEVAGALKDSSPSSGSGEAAPGSVGSWLLAPSREMYQPEG